MQRIRLATHVFLIPALAFFVVSGCGKKEPPVVGGLTKPAGTGAATTGGGPKTAIEAKTWANLKGKVVFDGDAPKDDGKLKAEMEKHADWAKACEAGDTAAFTWRVNSENKGVANVLVFVEPPSGKYFKPNTPDEKTWKKDDVAVDQPHCAFEPHVLATFPGFYNGTKMTESGQKITIKNSAPVQHNTKYAGNALTNPGDNKTIPPGGNIAVTLTPDAKQPITLNCNFHQFMKGYIWALDTPYYAVTDKDGNFEIKGIPAGTPVRLYTWQEQPGFFNKGEAKGEEITLKEGDNPLDLKVKPK